MNQDISGINGNLGTPKIWKAYNFKTLFPEGAPFDYGSIMRLTGTSEPNNFTGDTYYIANDQNGRFFCGVQINGLQSIVWKESAQKSDLVWKELTSVTSSSDTNTEIIYPSGSINEFLISYGIKNSTQAYGGGTVVIYANESKPCFLPLYDTLNFAGIVFIRNNPSDKKLIVSKKNVNTDVLFKIWYR